MYVKLRGNTKRERESLMPGEAMISKGVPAKKWRNKKKKQACQDILMGIHSSQYLHSDFSIQVSKLYHDYFQGNLMARGHLESCCKSFVKKKFTRRVIKLRADMAGVVETKLENSPRKRLSLARCAAGNLPEMIILHSMHDVKIVFKRSLLRQITGSKLNSRPSYVLEENHTSSREAEAPVFRDIKSGAFQGSEEFARDDSASFKDGNGRKEKFSLKSISVIRRELPESTLGWPLLPRTTPLTTEEFRRRKARSMSLIEWVMNLPTRSFYTTRENQTDSDSAEAKISLDGKTEDPIADNEGIGVEVDASNNGEVEESGPMQETSTTSSFVFTKDSTQSTLGWPLLRIKTSGTSDSFGESEMSLTNQSTQASPKSQINLHFREGLAGQTELPIKLDLVLKLHLSGCKQFRYEELERATCNFSSENLIGEGGCSKVYKGSIHRGKLVAVKVLKQYKEAWKDFYLELDIMSSLEHEHITHLIGVCIEDCHLILVYNFLSKGSLDERLKGHNEKSILPWKVRFKVAIAVAEALNCLHNGYPHSVIHRDVKSSNILLSHDFQPQLSDFGLATWGREDRDYMISSEIVGTFGYIAPEYLMYGRVSEKIDIYSFGIVLLELLTGKEPISSKGIKGQESLAIWAMPLLENGNLEALVDPMLNGEFDIVQMQRMVLAATICIKQSPRLRPKASKIVNLLRGEKEVREWMNDYVRHLQESSYEEMDDHFPELNHKPKLDSYFQVLDEDDALSKNGGDTDTTTIEMQNKGTIAGSKTT